MNSIAQNHICEVRAHSHTQMATQNMFKNIYLMCGGRLERYVDVQVSTHVGEGNGKCLVYLDCGDIYIHICVYIHICGVGEDS